MIKITTRLLSRFTYILIASFTLISCNSNVVTPTHIANPPPFDYSDGEELRSRMHQLAIELQRLDNTLSSEIDKRNTVQATVIESLRNIERIAKDLQTGDISSKHQFLMNDMDKFLNYIKKAQWDAARKTPRYYMAGRIIGACVNCHKVQY